MFQRYVQRVMGHGLGAKGWGARCPGAADGVRNALRAVDGRARSRHALCLWTDALWEGEPRYGKAGVSRSYISYGCGAGDASGRAARAGHPDASASGTYANSSAHNITSPMTLMN
jgi:hypothetical protein